MLIIDAMPKWYEPAILLAHDSGLRAAESCGPRWFRFDLQHKEVIVKDVMERDGSLRPYPKGKKQREIPLSERTIGALRRARMRNQASGDLDFVLQDENGAPLT